MGDFEEVIEQFVGENFCADGCMECHEIGHSIIPNDYKGSYKVAIERLKEEIKRILGVKNE